MPIPSKNKQVNVHFSDYFNVDPQIIEDYGAFNISLINDLPLFIDPFLLFTSDKQEYQELHNQIIKYVRFLRDISLSKDISEPLLKSWFHFPEVKQNWLGYSRVGNGGSGLGKKFAASLHENLNTIFNNFGSEQITQGSHLEKLCLIDKGVGKDNISDFTTNLIKKHLLEYTQIFCKKYISDQDKDIFNIERVEFDYKARIWLSKKYLLPTIKGDYVILTPKDLLTRDEAWINKNDLVHNFKTIVESVKNNQLRAHLNEYFLRLIPDDKPSKKQKCYAALETISKYPEIIDYYIKLKEENGENAKKSSNKKVTATQSIFIEHVADLVHLLTTHSSFYESNWDTFEESYQRVMFLKHVIEHNDGYRIFYMNGKPIQREEDLQIIYRLTWFASPSDVNREVNNGRGPVDYKVSRGSKDKTLIEFKLASNSHIKRNLEKQVEIYEQANDTRKSIKVILYFTPSERDKILKILKDLNLSQGKSLILIDARSDNKPSASVA